MRTIRLAHVVESFAGGVFSFLRALINGLNPREYEVFLIYSARPGFNVDLGSFRHGVQFHNVPMKRQISPLADARALRKMLKIIREIQPDIIHAHSSKAGSLARVAWRLAGQGRFVYTPHGFSFFRQDIGFTQRLAFHTIERLGASLGGVIVACSRDEWDAARGLSRRCALIRNGVDTVELGRIASLVQMGKRPDGNNVVVATMGRITAARNPAAVIGISQKIRQMKPETKFIWIGGGEGASKLMDAGIEVTGWLPHDVAVRQLTVADIYLHPSRWEGLPLAVLEAMALGKPVVATNIMGNRDAVIHGVTGFLCNDENDLVSAVKLLLDDPVLRCRMGRRSASRASEEFSIQTFIRRWDELYRDLH